jgi:ketosteroid isomerase-like protein
MAGCTKLDTTAMSTQPLSAQDPIFRLRQTYIKAAIDGDVDALISLASDDIVVMSPNDTTVYGKAEWKAWWEEYFQDFRIVALTEPDRDLTISGDFATEVSGYMLAIVPVKGGTRIRDDGRFLTIWKRQPDGSWKMWQTMWNSVKPIGSGTNRYKSRLMQKKSGARK